MTEVVVVCGPALSGKTTYVREHAKRGDLIVDMDWIFAALTGRELYFKPEEMLPFAAAARDAILDRLMRPSEVRKAWVITSNPAAAVQIVGRLNASRVDLKEPATGMDIRRQSRFQERKWTGFCDKQVECQGAGVTHSRGVGKQ